MRAKPYPSYKPSGVAWLGDVPVYWEVKRLKYLASINDDALPETTDSDDELRYVDIGSVDSVLGITTIEDYIFEDAPSRARRIVKDGDTIVSTVRTYLRAIAAIRNPASNLIVSTGFAVIRPRSLVADYLSYALRESSFVETVVARSTGVSYPAVNASELGTIPIAVPPIHEQQAIAGFLDRETTRLDALIGKKRKLIEALQEKRSALISRTVTRGLPPADALAAGLDPHPPLKPSGIDWLGEVPAHWETGNIRRFAQMKTGHTPSRTQAEYWIDCTIPWFTLADVWQLRDERQKYLKETKEMISVEGLNHSAAELLPSGTVIFSRTASIGFSGIMPIRMATSQDFWNWICSSKLLPDYLLFQFRAMKQEFARLTNGSTHKTIYQSDAASLGICVPPYSEQQLIVQYVDDQTAKIDKMIATVEAAIEKLQEYRAALITAAITGKIDLRE